MSTATPFGHAPKPITTAPGGAGISFASGPLHAPSSAFAPKAIAGVSQAATGGSSGTGAPTSAAGVNFDPIAQQNVNDNLFKAGQTIAGYNTQIGLENNALTSALGNLQQQQHVAGLREENSANQRGGLLSTGYGGVTGNIAAGYAQRAGGLQSANASRLNELAMRIADVQANVPLYDDRQAEASAQRYAQQAAANPAAGSVKAAAKQRAMSGQQLAAAHARIQAAKQAAAKAKSKGGKGMIGTFGATTGAVA